MNHLLHIGQLTRQDVESLLKRAFYFKRGGVRPVYNTHYMANLFYENSTRTRVSFEMAARHLSLPAVNLDIALSSESKGEMEADTVNNLKAMGINVFVMRHRQEGFQSKIAEAAGSDVHIINAGEGTKNHPTQALLDLMTILEVKPDIQRLKIAIVGNIRHSRVANSLVELLSLMGAGEVVLAAPSQWLPKDSRAAQTTSLYEALDGADVIITLRVQKERISAEQTMDLDQYHREYALTSENLRVARSDAMVMHPGPVNRGIEINSEVVDGKQSYILQQVSNGVFMRMAVIDLLLGSHRNN